MNSEAIILRITPEEKDRVNCAWKAAPGFTSCSQYLRAALNAYAQEKIFQ